MSSARNQYPSTFPAVPPSLSAGDHGMRDYYAAQDTQRPVPHTLPNITPYLGLRARLSQVWINRWTILLLLVLARSLIAITGLHHDLDSAKTQALSACSGVESTGSALASMPHYMSQGVNELTASNIEKAVYGLMSMLLLTVTGVEEIVVFYINMLTSMYVCLLTFAVAGSLHAAIKVAEDVTNFLNKTLADIGQDFIKDVGSFQTDLNKFIGGLNSIPEIFGKKGSVPTLDIQPSLDKLDNLKLPSDIDQGLNKLNSSIPDFAQVNNFTNSVIRFPFEEVKKLINGSLHFNFDRSILPVPGKEKLTFCSDNNGISDFFDGLSHIATIARKIFIVVLLVAAILVCVPMAYREIQRWRTMQGRAALITQHSHDPLDAIYMSSRPYTSTAGIKMSGRFQSTRRRLLARWFVAYATSPPALFLLSLALAGLFSCLCQYILLKAVQKEVPSLVHEVGDFAGRVVGALNNASEQWAVGTNQVIVSKNDDINHDVFGWVNTTTGALNDTLNTFVDGMSKVINDTFGGTVLYDPVTEVLNCLIGLKIAGIEKALTWVSDNARVEFPLLPMDTFSLGAAASLASNGSTPNDNLLASSTNDKATDEITGAVTKVVNRLVDAIRTEALISTFLLLLWLLLVLLGLARACFLALGRDKNRGEGGPSYAGDIPLETQRPMSSAPAYEPPRPTPTPFPSFHAPVSRSRDGNSTSEESWRDPKLGYAGERALVGRVEGVGHVRGSSYGDLVDEKR